MSQTTVNFRMDRDLKTQMEQTCKNMGLTMTSAFTMFAVKVIKEQKIPFEITGDPFYSEENIKELERRVHNIEMGKSTFKEHDLIEVE